MSEDMTKSDLDSIKHPFYPGAHPPFHLVDYCRRILVALERMGELDIEGLRDGEKKERQIHLLCGVVDNSFRLGASKGAEGMKSTIIANLVRRR